MRKAACHIQREKGDCIKWQVLALAWGYAFLTEILRFSPKVEVKKETE